LLLILLVLKQEVLQVKFLQILSFLSFSS
jgi:hypothetical protein